MSSFCKHIHRSLVGARLVDALTQAEYAGKLAFYGRPGHMPTRVNVASSDAFILTMLGVENVAVYDGSLLEWVPDPTLPTTTCFRPRR